MEHRIDEIYIKIYFQRYEEITRSIIIKIVDFNHIQGEVWAKKGLYWFNNIL